MTISPPPPPLSLSLTLSVKLSLYFLFIVCTNTLLCIYNVYKNCVYSVLKDSVYKNCVYGVLKDNSFMRVLEKKTHILILHC